MSTSGASRIATAGGVATLTGADFDIATAGRGVRVAEGANARMGTVGLVAGSAVVPNTTITTNTRIFITDQSGGANLGFLSVTARAVGVSFTVTSSNALDTSVFAFLLIEPG